VPNLFTVPGDPLAGFLLAGGLLNARQIGGVLFCCLASLLLYCAGLLANDYFDLAVDRRERPDRPLPAGLVKLRTVLAAALVLAALGVAAGRLSGPQAMVVAAVLAGTVFLYDAVGKRIPVFGPVNMGACRGLSLLLGAAAVGWDGVRPPRVLLAACGLAAYVSSVTFLAARETGGGRVGLRRFAPAAAMLCWLATLCWVWVGSVPAAVLQVLAAGWALACVRQLGGRPGPAAVQKAVGRLLRGLLLVQASVAVAAGWQGMAAAGAVLAGWPVSALAARRFYAS
jgi:4-hydroxybenzoate polyprenyltransferase